MLINANVAGRAWYTVGMSEQWLTTNEAAELADYHPERIRELARDGKIKARKFGPVWQISRDSLLTYVEAQAAKGERRGPKPD